MDSKKLLEIIDRIVEAKVKKYQSDIDKKINIIVENKLDKYLGMILEQKKKSKPTKSSQIKSKLNEIFDVNELGSEYDEPNEYEVKSNFDVSGLPDNLQAAFTRNYSPLMNKIKEKKGKF